MKPSLEEIILTLPEIDEKIIQDHLDGMGEDYFTRFEMEGIRDHIRSISLLSTSNPVEITVTRKIDESVECIVTAFDYPVEFSLVTGVLAGMGFNIISGDVYTYKDISNSGRIKTGRRKIVDHFYGTLRQGIYSSDWVERLTESLKTVIKLLEKGDDLSVRESVNRVNEMVVRQIGRLAQRKEPVLYPVHMEITNDSGPFTRLKIISEDTFAFMYALSNALSLHKIRIEHVVIRTIHGRVEDVIDLSDSRGKRIKDSGRLKKIRLSALFTKQFTYFLSNAPDPYTALSRFETMVQDIIDQPFQDKWIENLTDPENLRDLARLLGASDFLWEDFIRLQYEALSGMLGRGENVGLYSRSKEQASEVLERSLDGAATKEERKAALNLFKDRETFLIDLDHILNPDLGFRFLSNKLSSLAELIINSATQIIHDDLVSIYGKPATVAGMEVKFCILGLGKLGGEALGYASDIEIMFVYSDSGRTDGETSIDNSEFFSLLVKGVYGFIQTKREGIFQIDLRLRPHGSSGPLACSIKSFCDYYGRGGQAHSYEVISLVRMRAIGGDPGLGKQLERIRNEIVYYSNRVNFSELRELRERQFREKSEYGRINAKYSPGGLVDLEYGVQTLQVMHGKRFDFVQTPRIHEALKALMDNDLISAKDYSILVNAYGFLRGLINGLRMLRGNAMDLFLPEEQTPEFLHLARRMGYRDEGPISQSQKLSIDLETHMAGIRHFAEKYFGLDYLPSLEGLTIADVVISENLPEETRTGIFAKGGISNPERAYKNLKYLSGKGSRRDIFSRLIILAWDILKRTPDPDMALNNWERFTRSLASPEFHFNLLMSQPMRLEILLKIFSSSQFLSDTLVRNPGFFEWLTDPELLNPVRKKNDLESELRTAAENTTGSHEWRNILRRFRRREILRIGTRDICLNVSTTIIMKELSLLAEAITNVTLEYRLSKALNNNCMSMELFDKNTICILAFGKLGGEELNYSSDIDLIGVYSCETENRKKALMNRGAREISAEIMEEVCADLTAHTEEGYAYRVDLRLRPFGSSGELVHTHENLMNYYTGHASLWELQALIKLRPVAGNLYMGYRLIEGLKTLLLQRHDEEAVFKEIRRMRKNAIRLTSSTCMRGIDVKTGEGGIRDIEFTVQGLQLINAPENSFLLNGNTLLAIESLNEAEIISEEISATLKNDYIFLRRIEHYLQILDDRQVHTIPEEKREIEALAKRVLGTDSTGDRFIETLHACLSRVKAIHDQYIPNQFQP